MRIPNTSSREEVRQTFQKINALAAVGITTADITNWDTAYGWGDWHHTTLVGYGITDACPIAHKTTEDALNGLVKCDGAGTYSAVADSSGNWNTAYGWGNHANAGYLTSQISHADVVQDGDFTSQGIMLRGATSGSYSMLTNNSSSWNTAIQPGGAGSVSGLTADRIALGSTATTLKDNAYFTFDGITFSEGMYSKYAPAVFNLTFAAGEANQKADIIIPPASGIIWGHLIIRILSAYSGANAGGCVTKVLGCGLGNTGTNFISASSHFTEVTGPIGTHFTIGDLYWNSGTSKWCIPIVHRTTTTNQVIVFVEFYTTAAASLAQIKLLTFSAVYTTDSTVYPAPSVMDTVPAGATNVHLTTTLKNSYDGAATHVSAENAINGLVKCNGAGTYSAVTDSSSNWNTAYGWGNHAGLYDATGAASTVQGNLNTHAGLSTTAHSLGESAFHANTYFALSGHNHSGIYDPAGTAATTVGTHESTYNHSNYNTAYGWGNHASVGYVVGAAVLTDTRIPFADSNHKLTDSANLRYDGTNVILSGLKYPNADGTAGYVIKTDGSGNLSFVAQSGGVAYDSYLKCLTTGSYRAPELGVYNWQPNIKSVLNTPPATPSKGDRYIVGSSPTGAWDTWATHIAWCSNATGPVWSRDVPAEGWHVWNEDTNADYIYGGASWVMVHSQNTDTGTTSATFAINSGGTGFKLKDNSGVAEIRNSGDSVYANLKAADVISTTTVTVAGHHTQQVIDSSVVLYIATTGNDSTGDGTSGSPWATIAKAMSYLGPFNISSAANVIIRLADGQYTTSSATVLTHTNGSQISIEGTNIYAKKIDSIQSSSGGSGAWAIILNLTTDDVTNIAVNDYILISGCSGGSNPAYLNGCHKVTNVDTGNKRITITSVHKNATAPSGAVTTTTGVVVKSVITCSSDGLWVSQSKFGGISKLVVVGPGATGNGITSSSSSDLTLGANVGVCNFANGILALTNSQITATQTPIASGCTVGIYASTAKILNYYSITSGCTSGILADQQGFSSSYFSISTGCTVGIGSTSGSFVFAMSATTPGCGTNTSPNGNTIGNDNSYIKTS